MEMETGELRQCKEYEFWHLEDEIETYLNNAINATCLGGEQARPKLERLYILQGKARALLMEIEKTMEATA
jgi:hypothetical protein